MPLPSSLSVTLKDAKGVSSNTSYFVLLDSGMTVANLQEIGERWVEDLDNVTGCVITGMNINYAVDISDPGLNLKTAALPDTDVEEGARFSFRTALGFLSEFRIPGFLESLYPVGSAIVNILAPAVAELIADVVDGIGYGTGLDIDGSDNRGEDLVSLDAANEQHVAQRRTRR